jgi:SAM-dependent methyltransferase
MTTEKEIWNAKYAEGSHTSLTPDPLLISAFEEYITPLFPSPGKVLDVAGGVGRHAIWLAHRGWDATALDVSEVGVRRGIAIAEESGVTVKFELTDLQAFQLPIDQFDLVLVFFYLQRDLFPAVMNALKPGGILIYKTYTTEQSKLNPGGGPTHPMHLLQPNELLHSFSSMNVLLYKESVKDRGIAELIARKK